jgi:CyaY protein
MTLDPSDFYTKASAALAHIDDVLGDLEHDDLDVDLAGDVLTIDFESGGKFIVNAHSAAGQVWLAANTAAWHFDWIADANDGAGAWIASKSGDELMHTVARVVGERIGEAISL